MENKMKQVIYKDKLFGVYCCTSEENYNARIQNAHAIQRLDGFESVEQIIEYYCKWFHSKPDDFIVVE